MSIEALYRKPNTSKPVPRYKIYPYLLRKLPINRPNQVVISPFLTGCLRRIHAAIFSFMAGVIPPMPMFGRSLL